MKRAGLEPESISEAERQLLVDLYDSDVRYCSRHLERLVDSLKGQGCGTRRTFCSPVTTAKSSVNTDCTSTGTSRTTN